VTVLSINNQSRQTPFIDAVAKRFNLRISSEEVSLLATYERYWLMTRVVGPVKGAEKRYLNYLANKYKSFLRHQL